MTATLVAQPETSSVAKKAVAHAAEVAWGRASRSDQSVRLNPDRNLLAAVGRIPTREPRLGIARAGTQEQPNRSGSAVVRVKRPAPVRKVPPAVQKLRLTERSLARIRRERLRHNPLAAQLARFNRFQL